MLQEFTEIAEVFLGFGESYPKSEIVNFLVSTTNESKNYWSNKSDSIYYSYLRAVKDKNYPIWQSIDPAGSEKIVNYVTVETSLPRQDVYTYLLSLYTMAKMGIIKTDVWNPKPGIANYAAQQTAEAIKTVFSPVATVAAQPTKNLLTGLLIAGGLTAIGIFASKEFIKQKAKKI